MTDKNKTYNATDFERYHNGSMPASEMHALEKAALEDPFLADALEGYTYSSSVAKDISELRSRLPENKKKKNVAPLLSFRENGWWRIAALLAVVAGAAYFFFQMNYRKTDNNTLAIHQEQDSTHKTPTATAFGDTSQKNNLAFEKNLTSKPVQKKVNISPAKKLSKENYLADTNKEPSQSVASANVLRDKLNDRSRNEAAKNEYEARAAKKYLLKGKVTDEQGHPMAFAIIQEQNRKKGTTTDTSGNFSFYSNDSSINATVSASGYTSKEIELKENEEPVIVVNRNNASLSEVVVTGYGTRKRKNLTETASVSKQLNGKINGLETNPVINNDEDFDKYLEKNTMPLYDRNDVRLTGDVILSFKVNKKGRPGNISILKSSCEACEEEAVKLLKNGPDWKIKKDTRQNALIKF